MIVSLYIKCVILLSFSYFANSFISLAPKLRLLQLQINMASTEPSTPSTLSTSSISESTTTSSPEVPETTDRSDSEYYISCGSCKAVYLFPNYKAVEHAIGSRGTRVRCSVCDKQWFQSLDKAGKIDNMVSYDAITKERAVEMKKFITDNNWGRVPRGEKIDLFIGNIPFTYDEIDICK